MNNPGNAIVQLNAYPPEKYNVLVPVTTMQAASNLQKIVVSEVQLDVRQNSSNTGPSKDIYYEKSSNAYAITKVGGMKLAAAANISIVSTVPGRTDTCERCIEMARATGKARACGDCPHVHDVAVTVTIRVPEPSGGFRLMQATKEIDTTLERKSMSTKQYDRFLPHRTAMAESKAFMRAIRAALGLPGTYDYNDLRKPFIIARVVPNLDAPEIKDAVAANYLNSLGMLFEQLPSASPQRPALGAGAAQAEQAPETVPAYPDETPGDYAPVETQQYSDEPSGGQWGDSAPQPQQGAPSAPPAPPAQWGDTGGQQAATARGSTGNNGGQFICADCRRPILPPPGKNWNPSDMAGYSKRQYGRQLCQDCQNRERGARR